MEQEKILIQINNAAFRYPSEDYLFNDVKLTVKQGDKTAIVGANGSGKSTLLKILTGEIKLEEGNQFIDAKAYYVPQIDLTIQQKELKIYEYITEYYDEWWDVLTKLETLFNLNIDSEKQISTLSGGELMKLNLAIALQHNPEVLILDEPTNHLDIKSINILINFINNPKNEYTYIIVSHDIMFLDKVVNNIWELEDKKVTAYGGNYSFYKEQKALHLNGVRKQYEIAKEKYEKTKELELKQVEKQSRKANHAKLAFIKGSMDKRAYHVGKNAASSLQHSNTITLGRLQEDVEEKLEEFETEERKLAFINMKNTSENSNRTIFELKNSDLSINKEVLIKNINLKITYGDRVVIAGDNGTGKTTLVKALLKKNNDSNLSGEKYMGDNLEWVYIDQHYSLIKPELNLIQNVMASHSSLTEAKAKEQLGKFQFKTETEVNKLGKDLSGGQMVRLIMAMVTAFPIDLIILDEPTNNLDIETVEVLIKMAYLIKDKKLKTLEVIPNNREAFYKKIAEE